ncbi:hypothetical protein EIP86_006346 [Pleurotus ostreatoroseus]|nr:hypothetical protein EIP86_006346 [Pleurotus ostreatoroseus]
MPPPPFTDDSRPLPRLRANTSGFAPFVWRRAKPTDAPPSAPPEPAPPLAFDALLDALAPPAVPSLAHARALAAALATHTPAPRLAALAPVLASLCAPHAPPAVQAAGFDVLAAYWEHAAPPGAALAASERLGCLSLFLPDAAAAGAGGGVGWTAELWEHKFKAFVALTNAGTATVGMEAPLLRVLRAWIADAFSGLLPAPASTTTIAEGPHPSPALAPAADADEYAERTRSAEALTQLLLRLVARPEFVARLAEADTDAVLRLFGALIDRALAAAAASDSAHMHNTNTSVGGTASPADLPQTSPPSPSAARAPRHHRHHSSLSLSQVPPASSSASQIASASSSTQTASHGQTPTPTPTPTTRGTADLAVHLYLAYLRVRLKAIAPVHLRTILAQLFRVLGHYAAPLPVVSLSLASAPPVPAHGSGSGSTSDAAGGEDVEAEVTALLDALVTGPYSASCTVILKQHLFPPPLSPSPPGTAVSPIPAASPTVPTSTSTSSPASASIPPLTSASASPSSLPPPTPSTPPAASASPSLTPDTHTPLGALRTLRLSIRRTLTTRLARAYLARAGVGGGAAADADLPRALLERAWAPDEGAGWDVGRVRGVLGRAVRAWVGWERVRVGRRGKGEGEGEGGGTRREEGGGGGGGWGWEGEGAGEGEGRCAAVLAEVAGLVKDVAQTFDETGEELDYEEVEAVGAVLRELVVFVRMQKCVSFSPLFTLILLFFSTLLLLYAPYRPLTPPSPSRNPDGTPARLSLSLSSSPSSLPQPPPPSPSPLLSTLSTLLSASPPALLPILPPIALSLAAHLADADTCALVRALAARQGFTPTAPAWLENWRAVLGVPGVFGSGGGGGASSVADASVGAGVEGGMGAGIGMGAGTGTDGGRPQTRRAVLETLSAVWSFVRDIRAYRRPLAALVCGVWRARPARERDGRDVLVVWRILGEEIVLRGVEREEEEREQRNQEEGTGEEGDRKEGEDRETGGGGEGEKDELVDEIIEFLTAVASAPADDDADAVLGEITSPLASASASASAHLSGAASPILSRMQTQDAASAASSPGREKEKESAMPSVMSLLTSLTSGGGASRSQSQPRHGPAHLAVPDASPHAQTPTPDAPPAPAPDASSAHGTLPRPVGAVVALVSAFSQLAFTSLAARSAHLALATRLFRTLVGLLGGRACARAQLTALQFLMRLRVDRSHRLYFAAEGYDREGLVKALAGLVGRGEKGAAGGAGGGADVEELDVRRARPREAHARVGRRLSRGRGGQPSASESSRSRSRAASRVVSLPMRKTRPTEPLWSLPETLPFVISAEADTPSERLSSFDPTEPENKVVLPLSSYLKQLVGIVAHGRDWELLSYVLCHLPAQLANKHLFCGPRSKGVLVELLVTICNAMKESRFAAGVARWPEGVIARDAQGLAYHTLTVLISYKRCFRGSENIHLRHALVEAFYLGLSEQPSTIKCCLNALAVSAFELQPSMTKWLPRVLEKLSQIMSSPAMAVHIIDLLAIVGSSPVLYSNFTEGDFKMVFGVALQYLQLHTRQRDALPIPWALSQHVCIMSYYIVYLWFLAVRLADRPRHIKFIVRQLLLANEGKAEVDEQTEVCFDWLARYTYASADPRPANSMLSDIILHPLPSETSPAPAVSEKTWIMGNTVLTIRALEKRGWVEVISRRASGLTKFLCRAENVPMVTPGDVDPDLLSVAASLTMDRSSEGTEVSDGCEMVQQTDDGTTEAPVPDAITGYVWSGSAPSQRRKEVSIDPSYFTLQLSSYPDSKPSSLGRILTDPSKLPAFFRSLDRMPVIDTHKVGIMYVAPGQQDEREILGNTHGSPAYTRFLEGLGRLINLRGQVDVYAGGLDPDEDGEYAYAWWDDIGQILYHTATLMPSTDGDGGYTNKKRHIGNDFVRIVWNDSGGAYKFDTLSTQFQFVNIVIEPHSRGAIAAFSHNRHENEYFKLTVQRAPGMPEFTPVGEFKLVSAESLPLLVRQLSLLADWFVTVYQETGGDGAGGSSDEGHREFTTNWRARLQTIKRLRTQMGMAEKAEQDVMEQEAVRDFTTSF